MPCMGFEPTIPVSERLKTVHTLDRAATVTGSPLLILLDLTSVIIRCEESNYAAAHYATFFGLLSLSPSYVQYSSQHPVLKRP
jgi:hypothetical protein